MEYRQTIVAGGQAIAIVTDYAGSGAESTRYLHKDHLGSITLITNELGKVIERHSFDAWGAPTKAGTLTTNPFRVTPLADTTTPRGYTGHDMLDHLGLINMNGRIYDQNIGRFLSADPFVQFPASTQGYNRYTYVGNNPLSYTDPSGYFSLRNLARDIGGFLIGGSLAVPNPLKEVTRWMFAKMSPQMASAVIAIGSSLCGPAAPACAAAGTYEYQRANGVSRRDAGKAALAAAVSTFATQQAGAYADAGKYGRAFGTAYAGGYTSSRINGGDGVRGGVTASLQLGLKVAMDKYAGHNSTMDPAGEGAVVKADGGGVQNALASNTGMDIVAPPGDDFVGRPLNTLSQSELAELAKIEANAGKIINVDGRWAFSGMSEGGAGFTWAAQNVPGVNGFSVFHDQWMRGINNDFVLISTIPPAVYLFYASQGGITQYEALRVYSGK